MTKYIYKTSLIMIGCIICLIASAWMHDRFLIALSLISCAVCGFVLAKSLQLREDERSYLEELKRREREETNLKLTREITWLEYITDMEGKKI